MGAGRGFVLVVNSVDSNNSETGVAESIVTLMRGAATNNAVDDDLVSLDACDVGGQVLLDDKPFRMLVDVVVTKHDTSQTASDSTNAARNTDAGIGVISVNLLLRISKLRSFALLRRRRRLLE